MRVMVAHSATSPGWTWRRWDTRSSGAFVDEVGRKLGQAAGVNLCYQRPRRLPDWPYNLFCMVHGREREQVCRLIEQMLAENGLHDVPHQLLFSTRAFKQCGGRYAPPASQVAAHG